MITENNWLQSNICELKTNKELPYITCEYEPSNFKPSTFREASMVTAWRIKQKYKHIYVAYSGGSDSEFILDRLCEIDANPKPVFVDVYYSHAQLAQVKNHCEYLGIEPIVISILEKTVARVYEEKLASKYNFIPGMFNTFLYLLIEEHVKQIHSDAIIVTGEPALSFFSGLKGIHVHLDLFETLTNVILPFLWYNPQQAYEMLSTIKKIPCIHLDAKVKLYGISYAYKKHKNVIRDWDAYRIEVKEKIPAFWEYVDRKELTRRRESIGNPPPEEAGLPWPRRVPKAALFKRKGSKDKPDLLNNVWRNFKK